MKNIRSLILGFLVLSCACSDSLDPIFRIERVRLIASRTDIAAKPDVAAPDFGDEVDLTLRVAVPGAKPIIQWNAAVCVPAPISFGVPFCLDAELTLPCTSCMGTMPSDPVITFQIPVELEDPSISELIVLGAICAEGAVLEGEAFKAILRGETSSDSEACQDPEDQGELFAVRIPLQESDPANRHPEIELIERDNQSGAHIVWGDMADPSDPRVGCDDSGISEISSGASPIAITLSTTFDSHEEISTDPIVNEELQVSWRVTDGELNRSFSFIKAGFREATNVWAPPRGVDSTGELVRFHFVLRDGRGGTAWTERALCVVP